MQRAIAERYVRENEQRFLHELSELVRIPSVSGLNPNPEIARCGRFLLEVLRQLGLEARMWECGPDPVILGQTRIDARKPTLLIYGHFDVQPPDPLQDWSSFPFEPRLADGRMFGRGTGDNKGQFFAHLKAIELYRELGLEPAVNVKFLLDGGEETGSRGLAQFVSEHGELLHADVAFASDGSMRRLNEPLVFLGTKGAIYTSIRLDALLRPVHSSHAPILPNAAIELAHLLAGLIDRDGTVLIPHFFDGVTPATQTVPDLGAEYASLLAPGRSLRYPQAECETRLTFDPAVNVSGVVAGFTGDGSQAAIPAWAEARLDISLVAGQNSRDAFAALRARIAALGHDPDCAELLWSVEPSHTPLDSPYATAAASVLTEVFGSTPVVLPSYPSYGPCGLFTNRLGIPGVYIPYAQPDENNHGPDENLRIDHLLRGIVCSALVLDRFGLVRGNTE